MEARATFCVLYRFEVRAGQEERFVEAWRRLTEAVRDTRGGLGSRLHRDENGVWVAYAQWPSRQAWAEASANQSPAPDASLVMREVIEKRLAPIYLEPHTDLLTHVSAGARDKI